MFIRFLCIFTLMILKIYAEPLCIESKNYCSKCNPLTNQCIVCLKEDILVPDTEGGCVASNQCKAGRNYCLDCESDGKKCKTCDYGYYPDENGACSYSNYCKISYKGNCLECSEDYILIKKNKICKSTLTDDFKNCKEINTDLGICKECEEGYFLNKGDKKCLKVENCYESMFGICLTCNEGYYFDKKENKCKEEKGPFSLCKETVDGENCDKCDSGSYLDEGGLCVQTNFCSESSNGKCNKCKSGYYLSSNNNFCTTTKNCYIGDKDTGLCLECNMYYYIDSKDYKCYSNLEENEFKYCEKVIDNVCVKCESGYYLGKDKKCTNTKNCEESENGKCVLCSDNYYLGLDNYCSDIEKCIYSRFNNCRECEDGYYYHPTEKKCLESKGIKGLENCKYLCLYPEGMGCCECKNNYYLNLSQNLCMSNDEKGPLYKCGFVLDKEEQCFKCIDKYYLGSEDKLCSLISNCKISENENKCKVCDDNYCLDAKSGKCIRNDFLDNENNKIYIACKKTNEEGSKCEKCVEGYEVNEQGLCVDVENCEGKKEGKCIKCNSTKNSKGYHYCANEIFGCLEGHFENCLRCDNLLNLYQCTECMEGYEINQYGACVPKA